jgi:flagellar biosynthesis protein FlhA
LLEVIKLKAHELLGREEVKKILDVTKEKYATVVEELVPDLLTLGEVQKILQNLLKEKVSIKDRVTILETLADNAKQTKDLETLTEYVRIALSKNICRDLIDDADSISVTTLSREIEESISGSLQKSTNGTYPALSPDYTNGLFTAIQEAKTRKDVKGEQLILLVSPKIRMPFRKLIEMVFPEITVLSLNEIPSTIRIKSNDAISF